MKSKLLKSLTGTLLFWFLVISAAAQIHTDQNGLKSSVIDELVAQNTQALRYEVATLGFNSYHWQTGGVVIVELFNKFYSNGYERYVVENNVGNPKLRLIESLGSEHLAKVSLGQIYELSTEYGGYPNVALPIYVDVTHYARYRVKITYQQDRVDNLDNINQLKVNTAPTPVAINHFAVSTSLDNPVTSTQNLMISGIGPHYISQGNVGIGTTSPEGKLSVSTLSGTALKIHGGQSYMLIDNVGSGENYLSGNMHAFQIAGAEKMRIHSNGNIGIGTDVPFGKLEVFHDVQNANGNAFVISSNGGAQLRMGNNTGYSWIQSHGTKPLYIIELGNDLILNLGNSYVGIGLTNPSEKLTVNGKIKAREVRVNIEGMPDYVFAPAYQKLSLSEIENYIRKHQHLPEIPSAAEAEKNGLELGEMNKLLLKKIEELTLHLIDQDKELKAHKQKETNQEKRLRALEEMLLKR